MSALRVWISTDPAARTSCNGWLWTNRAKTALHYIDAATMQYTASIHTALHSYRNAVKSTMYAGDASTVQCGAVHFWEQNEFGWVESGEQRPPGDL